MVRFLLGTPHLKRVTLVRILVAGVLPNLTLQEKLNLLIKKLLAKLMIILKNGQILT
jgi:hypothetical protein